MRSFGALLFLRECEISTEHFISQMERAINAQPYCVNSFALHLDNYTSINEYIYM